MGEAYRHLEGAHIFAKLTFTATAFLQSSEDLLAVRHDVVATRWEGYTAYLDFMVCTCTRHKPINTAISQHPV